MTLKVLVILAFIGILSGLARLLRQEEIDLDNLNEELVKCHACGDYIPRNQSLKSAKNFYCKNCKT